MQEHDGALLTLYIRHLAAEDASLLFLVRKCCRDHIRFSTCGLDPHEISGYPVTRTVPGNTVTNGFLAPNGHMQLCSAIRLEWLETL